MKIVTLMLVLSVMAGCAAVHAEPLQKPTAKTTSEKCGCGRPKGDCAFCKAEKEAPHREYAGRPAGRALNIYIEGMHCRSCIAKVSAALKKVDGIKSIEVNQAKGFVTVTYGLKKPDAKTIVGVVKKAGHKVKSIQDA
jgi:Cu+-exporting ATPase